jgi:UDP-glucose 4-epimerase
MKVALLGGNGFLGRELYLQSKKTEVECYVISRGNTNSDFNVNISNYNDFEKLPYNFFDIVINCATTLPGGNYLDNKYLEKIYKTNILGTQNICKWINEQSSIKKIINCSTLAVVGKPWSINLSEAEPTYPTGDHVLYSSSKLTQELLFKTFATSKNITLTQIRFSSLYGATMNWGGLICSLIEQSRNQKKMYLTNASKVSADFLHVSDASKIILATIQNDVSGILNAASGIETSVIELAKIINSFFEEHIEIQNVEKEKFNEDRAVVNVSKLKQIIDINSFVDLKTGIKEMIRL